MGKTKSIIGSGIVQIAEFDISVERGASPVRSVRAFRCSCWDDVKSCLSDAPWSVMELFDDINDMWELSIFSFLKLFCR